MYKTFTILLILLLSIPSKAQFSFSGAVNEEFRESTVYLNSIDDFSKSSLFLAENILLETKVDSFATFTFTGDFLDSSNRLYKIYIDNCNENVSNYKHLNEHCDKSRSILFIANNKDSIHFPLNDLSQMFCDFEFSNESNIAISKIDSLQEFILSGLQNLKNDSQRKLIYKKHFEELQHMSLSYEEPLVELYAHHLYANDQSLSKSFYQSDLIHSKYYLDLLTRLKNKYPNTNYYKHYQKELRKEQYPFLKQGEKNTKLLFYLLGFLLFASLLTNIYFFRKTKSSNRKKIDYKTMLTSQEQKVLELMYGKMTNKEIAASLYISLSTVKTHINNIYSKLSINSRKDIDDFFKN